MLKSRALAGCALAEAIPDKLRSAYGHSRSEARERVTEFVGLSGGHS